VTDRACLSQDAWFGSGGNFGSITLMFSTAPIRGVQLEDSGVMLPKFSPDPALTSHYKLAMSVTFGWV
jgi:hypothetical protein